MPSPEKKQDAPVGRAATGETAPSEGNAAGAAGRRVRPIYRVFVSSTWLDLQPERRALMDALNRMEEMRFVGMEFFGNRPDDTHDASIDQVEVCEVFVGIIGFRYGSGITETEYRRARELRLPCFVYFKRADASRPDLTDDDATRAAKLTGFKHDLLRDHTVKEFASPDELAANATADLHNWVAARWVSTEGNAATGLRAIGAPPDADRTNLIRLLERIQHDWIEGVLEASLHHQAWLELGLDWRNEAVEHPWDRIVVAPNRPIQTLRAEESITGVFADAQNTLLILGEPGAGKTTTLLELGRELIARARRAAQEPAPVVLALSTWTGAPRDFSEWLVAELGLRYQVPKRIAQAWLENGRLVLLLDGLDEVAEDRRSACVDAINAFAQAHPPPGLAVTCRVAEYDALAVKLRLRAAICLQPLTLEQVEHYFAAAGAGLEHLRQAMRDDGGLRELARTPLMLSVMTMAWRDVPAADVRAPGAIAIEERRRQLFDAYVRAALNRRGKATGGYSAEQTVGWLAWLARRMKERGHTLFAVEQLQPGWLDRAGRQFGYFMTTRLLGTVGLALPLLLWKFPLAIKATIAALAVVLGLVMGGLDFGFARRRLKGGGGASQRFWLLLLAFAACTAIFVVLTVRGSGGQPPLALAYGIMYLAMAGFAFCVPLDVCALDVKPTDTMRWSPRLGLQRAMAGLVGMNLLLVTFFALGLVVGVLRGGWRELLAPVGQWEVITGGTVTAVLVVAVWVRLRPRRTAASIAVAATWVMLGAQIGAIFAANSGWPLLLLEIAPAVIVGVFGGFASSMIDPTRARRTGAWFWLRVPVLAFLVVGLVMTVPGLVWISSNWADIAKGRLWIDGWFALRVGAACGWVAFFRFGGFNGVQHFVLRWQLARGGNLPSNVEGFLNHAAQLALLQKVGFGYRFIHALLLDHLAAADTRPAGRRDIR